MDKRLQKRHKRQVARAKAQVRISEPDVRTHEEVTAAREASQAGTAGHNSMGMQSTAAASTRSRGVSSAHSASKSDA